MPDFQNITVTDLTDVQVTVPRFRTECEVWDGTPYIRIGDFTGANAITFPGVLAQLTAKQRRALLRGLIRRIIMMKLGLDDGTFSDF